MARSARPDAQTMSTGMTKESETLSSSSELWRSSTTRAVRSRSMYASEVTDASSIPPWSSALIMSATESE